VCGNYRVTDNGSCLSMSSQILRTRKWNFDLDFVSRREIPLNFSCRPFFYLPFLIRWSNFFCLSSHVDSLSSLSDSDVGGGSFARVLCHMLIETARHDWDTTPPCSFERLKIKAGIRFTSPDISFSGEMSDEAERAIFNATMVSQRGNRGWIYGIQNRQESNEKVPPWV